MTHQDLPKHQNSNDPQGFPFQLKLLLGVIGLGLLGIVLKVSGVF